MKPEEPPPPGLFNIPGGDAGAFALDSLSIVKKGKKTTQRFPGRSDKFGVKHRIPKVTVWNPISVTVEAARQSFIQGDDCMPCTDSFSILSLVQSSREQPFQSITARPGNQSERPPINYRLREWFHWFSKHSAGRKQIGSRRSDAHRRLDALSRMGNIPEELVRVLTEDYPQNVDTAMEGLKTLPWEQVEQLLTTVVRIHPSPTVRNEAQKAIFAENPFEIDIDDPPRLLKDDAPKSVLKAAALMEGRWTIFLFKKLMAMPEAWQEAMHVLKRTDYPYPQDLAYVLWKMGVGHVRIEIAETAYAILPPHALIWKSRMKKLASF